MTFSGVHRGNLFGVPATGRNVTSAGAAFFTIDGDHIAELWVLGDVDAVKRLLGPSTGGIGSDPARLIAPRPA